jgi:hypothetical protein
MEIHSSMMKAKTINERRFINLEEVTCKMLVKKDGSREVLINFSTIIPRRILNKLVAHLKDNNFKPILVNKMNIEYGVKGKDISGFYCIIETGKNGKTTRYIKKDRAHLNDTATPLDYTLIISTVKEVLDWIDDDDLIPMFE